jgi:hypothetical protein
MARNPGRWGALPIITGEWHSVSSLVFIPAPAPLFDPSLVQRFAQRRYSAGWKPPMEPPAQAARSNHTLTWKRVWRPLRRFQPRYSTGLLPNAKLQVRITCVQCAAVKAKAHWESSSCCRAVGAESFVGYIGGKHLLGGYKTPARQNWKRHFRRNDAKATQKT